MILNAFHILLLSLPLLVEREIDYSKLDKQYYLNQFEIVLKDDDNYEITGIKDEYLNNDEFRIYFLEETKITSINVDAFKEVNHDFSIMISDNITYLPSSLFDINHNVIVNYTGDLNDLNYTPSDNVEPNDYACDEGFINYWNKFIRPDELSNICLLEIETYQDVNSRYNLLSERDRYYVDAYTDKSGSTIKDAIEYMNVYYDSQSQSQQTDFLSQEQTVALITGIAILGTTFISVLYFLKQKDYIS